MTPDDFIRKWRGVTLTERASSQEHFIDLCRLLGEQTPTAADPQGVWYAFEKGARKAGGGDGWADVWKRGCFGWEYKGPGKDLDAAFKQLQLYTPALEYPPLLIVSDVQTIRIHTAFTGLVPVTHKIGIEDLRDPATRKLLKWAFTAPDKLKPIVRRDQLTEQAASQLGALAQTWRGRGHDPFRVAHLCQQILFCLFAEDIGLLPDEFFTKLLRTAREEPASAQELLESLFGVMATGGRLGLDRIDWFNGGLFATAAALPLEPSDIQQLLALASLDWSAIDPTIAGTLFVRGLDPALRAQLGAQYTDPKTIMRLVNPVVLDPLRAEWAGTQVEIQDQIDKAHAAKSAGARTKALKAALGLYQGYLERLRNFRVLDAACGSGNFLLLALLGLKDLEHQVILEAEAMGLPRAFPLVGPENVLGIEINPFAAELARVVIWIGEIQWMLNHGFALSKRPILKVLDNIQLRDAILNPDETEPEWPAADVIVGNPPFLGGSKKRGALGDAYFEALDRLYAGRVPAGADLVTYWFEKSRAQIVAGKAGAAGLVATNSIRGGANRTVLERIQRTETRTKHGESYDDDHVRHAAIGGQAQGGGFSAGTGGSRGSGHRRGPGGTGHKDLSGPHPGKSTGADSHRSDPAEMDDGLATGGGDVTRSEGLLLDAPLCIFNAWSDEPWINEGAAVRVSMICFGTRGHRRPVQLNGVGTGAVNADLTPSLDGDGTSDLTRAKALKENRQIGFQGTKKGAAFDISRECAESWMLTPNPHGRSNADVLKPWMNGMDITRRPSDTWIIDFGVRMTEADASLYEAPFSYIERVVKPERQKNRNPSLRRVWWRHERPRGDMMAVLETMSRIAATPRVAKYRTFVWLDARIVPDSQIIVITRADDTTFGILHSRFHELWSLRMGTSLEDRPRYTPTTTFETFPFPEGLTPAATGGPVETLDGDGIILPSVSLRRRQAALAIARAAQRLNSLRENWLNPAEWVEQVPEIVPGYPDRIIPKPEHAVEIKKRTLTNLYNARPAWLDNAHQALDAAVAVAYGWDDYSPALPDAEILRRLLALNLARSSGQQGREKSETGP